MESVFEVEGMTWLRWTVRIEAGDEAEALDLARRLPRRAEGSTTVLGFETLSHHVASCRTAPKE